ncbi:MAG: XrtA/PEP-CTERM system histidine kinase PrsK, partial [Steroidobacter sp.]
MNSVRLVSYGLAALAFAVLTVLLSVSWRGRRQGVYLIVASALTSIWALLLAAVSLERLPILALYIAEMLRNAGWLLALCSIAHSAAPRFLILATRGICALVLAGVVALPSLASSGSGLAGVLLARAGLLTSLLGLVLIEQIYRNSNESVRDSLRYLAIGVGALFAYDLFLYSQAELLRGVTEEAWNARGVLNALCVPLIAIAVRRYPQWSLDVFVSRQVVFYTTTFI